MRKLWLLMLLSICFVAVVDAQQKNNTPSPSLSPKKDSLKNTPLPGLSFRSIGPAITGGRITDMAVNPRNKAEYYVASGHGSLWKTSNNGTTFSPAFDGQSSFAMGAVRIDPSQPNIVWAGTGENNNQSNVIYGDGVYRSEDGGRSWKNMGLKQSEHIGGIAIDPSNSDVVYVAAYGPMRSEGGERGIFKTVDGGKTWRRSLYISEYTGCFEVHLDPKQPKTVYAVAHQRLRGGTTNVSGGPESAIYRSTDSGATWQKIMKGLPAENVGRIGMAISPANPDILFAIVHAKEGAGFYRSDNKGASWSKLNNQISAYPFYMQKIFADPKDENTVYSMDLLIQVSNDGGRTWRALGEKYKHVDNHVLWIDPDNTSHLISGNDGGVYETWDKGLNWSFKANLPIAEIYKVSTDNAKPFYNVYIGTQDNNSLMGPSRTTHSYGISNREWTFTLGGDGFETQADWSDDNILYAQSQNGGLVRYDKKTGEKLFIQPVNMIDSGYRFDWDAPLLISKHNPKRLYFAANKLFRTDDQGNSWKIISGDLTRGVAQKMNKLMGKSWSTEELAGKASSAVITSIAESPIDEQVLFAGTSDGWIHVSTDGGNSWTRSTTNPVLNEFTRVHHITASKHNKSVAYAACYAYTNGDYKPYLLKTSDGGKSWSLLNNNLPQKGSTFCIVEDHINEKLLFTGTQFGLYVSVDGGNEWIRFMNGLPTTTITDMEIQQRENDLVVATFGRGVYILDDYSALRDLTPDLLAKQAALLPIKQGLMYVEDSPLGFRGKGFQGADFYTANNPEPGVTFTYYLKEAPKTLLQKRVDAEKEKQKKGEELDYPSYDVFRKEAEQTETYLLFTITDEEGNLIRKIKTNAAKGVQRLTWNLRHQPFYPVSFAPFDDTYAWVSPPTGYMVVPGTYKVGIQLYENGSFTELVAPQAFQCAPIINGSFPVKNQQALQAFNQKIAEMLRAVSGANAFRQEMVQRLPFLQRAALDGSGVPVTQVQQDIVKIQRRLEEVNRAMNGDGLRGRYEGATPLSLFSRIAQITSALWSTTTEPTETFKASYEIAANNFEAILNDLRNIDQEIQAIERLLEKYKAPYTPGRLPDWKKQ